MAFTWSEVTVPTTGSSSVNVRDWVYDSGHDVLVGVGDAGLVYTATDPTDAGSWVKQTAAAANDWRGVAYAPTLAAAGRLCAVSGALSNQVMTSDDGGVTWTSRTSAQTNAWNAVRWVSWQNGGSGWFVAVASSGVNRVMTSPDGITWTVRTAAAATTWTGLADSGTLLVAINASSGTSRCMTSTDAITWTTQTTPAGLSSSTGGVPCGSNYVQWSSVAACFAWAAVVSATSARCIVTSPDGTTWTIQTLPDSTRSHGGLIPVATVGLMHVRQNASGYTNLINTSADGSTWAVEDPGFYRLWGAAGVGTGGVVVAWGDASSTKVLVGVAPTPATVIRVVASRGRTIGGKRVRIIGTGFSGTPDVTFDGTPATDVLVMSDTLIMARTPAHAAGLVDVDVDGVTLVDGYLYTDSLFGNLTIRYEQGIRIQDTLNDAPNTCVVRCDRTGSPESPRLGEGVQIIDPASGAILFGGTALVTTDGIDGRPTHPGYRDLDAGDLIWRLNAIRPYSYAPGKWEYAGSPVGIPADEVAQDLIDTFAPEFSLFAEAGLPPITLTCDRSQTLSEVFSTIATLIGGAWYVDDEFGVHLFLTNPDDSPDPITDASPLYDPPPTVSRDLTQIRNRIYVSGAGGATSYEPPVTPLSIGLTDTVLPTTGGAIPDGSYDYYITFITANGETAPTRLTSYAFGAGFVIAGADDAFQLTNLDLTVHSDPRVTGRRLWRNRTGSPTNDLLGIYLVTTLGNTIGIGENDFLDGLPDSSLTERAPRTDTSATIFVMVEDAAAQAYLAALFGDGDDGIREGYVLDESLTTLAQATARGEAELALFAYPITTVRYASRDEKTRSGKTVSITLTNPEVSGLFKIQQVTIDQIAIDAAGFLFPRFSVVASSVRFTLDDLLRGVTRPGAGGTVGAGGGSSSAVSGTGSGSVTPSPPPLSGTKEYWVSDTSGGAVTRKLTFIDGILTSET